MKNNIPLKIKKILHPVVFKNLDVIEPDPNNKKDLFYVKNKENGSDFYFQVQKQNIEAGKIEYAYQYKPTSEDLLQPAGFSASIEVVRKDLEKWIALVRDYNDTPSYFDDPIMDYYENYYSEKLNIDNEDAETAPFEPKQQFYLDSYLAVVQERIEDYKEGKTKQEKEELDELIAEAAEIKKGLGKLSKKKVAESIARLWGKTHKFGLELVKIIVIETFKEVTKGLIGGNLTIDM